MSTRERTNVIRKVSTLTERELQTFLDRNENLVPSQVGHSPMVCIGRNIPTNYGNIDCLFISPTGFVTAVISDMTAEQVIAITSGIRENGMDLLDEFCAKDTFHSRGQAFRVLDLMAERGLLTYANDVEFTTMTNTALQSGSLLLIAVGDTVKEDSGKLYSFLKNSNSPAFNVVFASN